MKTSFMFLSMIFLASLIGCEKIDLVDAPNIPSVDGKIQIMSPMGKIMAENDTVNTEQYLKMVFQGISRSGLSIASWQWTFSDGKTAYGSPAEYTCQLNPGGVVKVNLIGVEENGTPHSAPTCYIKVVNSLDGLDGLIWTKSTLVTSGVYSQVWAADKRSMSWHFGPYGYVINTASPWPMSAIPAADTNYNLVGGQLVAAESGSIGRFIAIRIIVSEGSFVYEFHYGPIVNGTVSWTTPWGAFSSGKFITPVGNNGKPIPLGVTPTLPGTTGDMGDTAVIRFSLTDSSIVLHPNNKADFSTCHPYIQLQDSAGSWQDKYLEGSVANFPNWGTFELPYRKFLIPGLLVMRIGREINDPVGSAIDISKSAYFDPVFKVLKIRIVVTSLPKVSK